MINASAAQPVRMRGCEAAGIEQRRPGKDRDEEPMTSQCEAAAPDQSNGVLPREVCVIRDALERQARERPDATYAVFEDGARWSFRETLHHVRVAAAGLYAAGVRQDDRVLVMLPNAALAVQALFAINWLGAVFVPINPALKGSLLEHVVADSGACCAIVHESLVERVAGIAAPTLTRIISSGISSRISSGISPGISSGISPGAVAPDPGAVGRVVLPIDLLFGRAEDAPAPARPIESWDLQSIMYTSGTTGRSKGVLSTYMHSYSAAAPETWSCTRPGDRHLLHMPIFHIGGAFVASVCLCSGSSIAVVDAFRTDTFWASVRRMEVTVVFLLGAMATFLLKAPPRPDDRDHTLRMVFIVPLGQSGPPFRERFGTDVYTLFNMTEISTPLLSAANPDKPGICGRPRPGVEVRLVDAHDCPVADGTVGQLVVRTAQPWAMTHGYHNNPVATAEAWRNGWFHTGDAFLRDADGDFTFVDRMKDAIRRRGENISSYEIEVELLAHPDIREAAAVPVPSEYTEDEVMVVVAPVSGRVLAPADIVAHLRDRVPHYMVPRYVRIVDALPKTPTEKVQKHVLRGQGITPDTWDRAQAGIVIRRDRL